ncbi:endonuclease [Bifidobacterium catulorum]|uniref:Endonuclease n=2 Tax=Bifidobacterium catulorum TaxID=1630173 RepID=A0A2U2MUF0_9BIFI|nr:endonuclease [Bifidobacterium catulorum]
MGRGNPRRRNGHRRDQLRKRVLAAYDTCAICGRPVDKNLRTPHPMSPEVDEIIPVSRGGDPLSFTNCRLTHRRCNRLKSNRSDDYARARLAHRPTPNATSLPLATSGDW